MVKLKMLSDQLGTETGYGKAELYKKGEVYECGESLAKVFIDNDFAEAVVGKKEAVGPKENKGATKQGKSNK